MLSINKNMNVLSFDDYTNGFFSLTEKLITIGGQVYPKNNNVVIMAGGAGSGKGFIINNLLGIEGKVLDIDYVKSLSQKTKSMVDYVKKITGTDISTLDMKNSKDVDALHFTLANLEIPKKYLSMIYSTASLSSDKKPNIIIDTTLRDYLYFINNCKTMLSLGYDKRNIHIVWVVNDFETANNQNTQRNRTVSKEVMDFTHEGTSRTMNKILNIPNLTEYMDGDIWIVFNKKGEDNNIVKSNSGGSFVDKSNIICVKKSGSPKINLTQSTIDKINQYVPKTSQWI